VHVKCLTNNCLHHVCHTGDGKCNDDDLTVKKLNSCSIYHCSCLVSSINSFEEFWSSVRHHIMCLGFNISNHACNILTILCTIVFCHTDHMCDCSIRILCICIRIFQIRGIHTVVAMIIRCKFH